MPDGWCPFANALPTANFGYPKDARGQNRPVIFVDHIMAGWKRTLDDPGWREPAGVGVHFGIGRDGSISQYTSILDAHWGNGVAGAANPNDRRGIDRYDRANSRLAELEREGEWLIGTNLRGEVFWWLRAPTGGSLLNQRSISFEHEGFPFDRDGFDATWPEAMIDATIRVKRWCLEELERLGQSMEVDHEMLGGHFQIDGVNRVNCPGPEWPRGRIMVAITQADGMPLDQRSDDMPKLISPRGRPEVYQVNGGSLDHIPDRETFNRLGYKPSDVEQVPNDDKLLDLPVTYQNGVPESLR